jgi:hypothetical protein
MNHQNFVLQPFAPASPPPPYRLTGVISRRTGKLAICYELQGPLGELAIPSPASLPARRHGLWQETCFELFLAVRNTQPYWEFNLSPAGHWNVYRFEAYRQVRQEEAAFSSLPFEVQTEPDSLRLALEVELAPLVSDKQVLEGGISAILQGKSGALSYWALAHFGSQPDFHRRDGFLISL